MAAPIDVGVGLSGSASSGASLSGATDVSGGGNYGGNSYGPGSLMLGGPTPAGTPLNKTLIAIALVVGAVALIPIFRRT